MNETNEQSKTRWSNAFKPLVGRTIKSVRWMSEEETKEAGWFSAPVVLQLDDGTLLYPQSDDEGNDGGALAVQPGTKTKGAPTIAPVI